MRPLKEKRRKFRTRILTRTYQAVDNGTRSDRRYFRSIGPAVMKSLRSQSIVACVLTLHIGVMVAANGLHYLPSLGFHGAASPCCNHAHPRAPLTGPHSACHVSSASTPATQVHAHQAQSRAVAACSSLACNDRGSRGINLAAEIAEHRDRCGAECPVCAVCSQPQQASVPPIRLDPLSWTVIRPICRAPSLPQDVPSSFLARGPPVSV